MTLFLCRGGLGLCNIVHDCFLPFISPLRCAQVTGEDISVVEAVQAAMQGGGYASPGCLSPRHEAGVGYFQGLVRQAHLKGGAVY